jgi:hypothetical protein
MKELVFLLEEASAKAMLESLLPRLLDPEISHRLIPFEGKQDLEKQMVRRLRNYLNPHARFIVMRDQDSYADCLALKNSLIKRCREAGKGAVTLVRIACRELESFYLADLAAVEAGLGVRGLTQLQQRAKFRQPDLLGSPSKELENLTKKNYQKVSGSRQIGQYLNSENVRSDSFRNLVVGIRRMEKELLEISD